jgi:molybdopterin-binding protein
VTHEPSARNQFNGTVTASKLWGIMAEVTVDIGGGHEMISAITRASGRNARTP